MTLILRTLRAALLLTAFMIVIAGKKAQAQGSAPVFTIREGLPDTDITVKQVTYGNGVFLACLIDPTRLYTSSDGIYWTKITGPPLGADTNVNNYKQNASIAFGAGRFVLTSDSGRIFSSADLASWTPSASGTTNNIATVQYLNGNFYAVGDAGTFLSSPDGLTWMARTTGIGNPLDNYQEVLYGNGHLVLTAVTPHTVYDSSAGGWTADSSRPFNEHGFARGHFYEFSVDSNLVSADLHNWSPFSVASDAGNGFAVFEDSAHVYLLSGGYDTINSSLVWDGRISSSDDGLNFGPINPTRVFGGGGGAWFNHRYFVFPGTGHAPLTGSGDGVHFSVQGSTRAFLSTNGHIYVKLSLTTDAAYLYTSSDLINWTARDTIGGVAGLTYDGTQFWAVGTETYTSPDGITWTNKGPSAHPFTGITYGNGTYIAWSPPGAIAADSLWYSPDGINWTQSTTPTASPMPREPPSTVPYGDVRRARFLNGNIVVLADAGVLYSTDPGNYNFTSAGSPLGQSVADVTYDADSGKYYFLGVGGVNGSGTVLLTTPATDLATTDGRFVTVDTIYGPADSVGLSSPNAFAYNHGHWVTVFDDGAFPPYPNSYLLWSSDGVHWDSRMLDRETRFASMLTGIDTFAIEGTHNYEILANFSGSTPLPVTLLNFRAVAEDNTRVLLTWQTASEQNSRRFIIQRNAGTDAQNWDSIGSLPAAGNSSILLGYSFTDEHPLTGNNYYRLVLINADNSSQFSQIRQVLIEGIVGISVYPNPARDQLVIQRTSDDGEGAVMLYDAAGRVVLQGVLTGISLTLPMEQLAAGVYQLTIRQPDGKVYRREILHYY